MGIPSALGQSVAGLGVGTYRFRLARGATTSRSTCSAEAADGDFGGEVGGHDAPRGSCCLRRGVAAVSAGARRSGSSRLAVR